MTDHRAKKGVGGEAGESAAQVNAGRSGQAVQVHDRAQPAVLEQHGQRADGPGRSHVPAAAGRPHWAAVASSAHCPESVALSQGLSAGS